MWTHAHFPQSSCTDQTATEAIASMKLNIELFLTD